MNSVEAPELCARLASLAERLLASLDAGQRAAASCEFAADERLEWHYTPVDLPGLMLGRMDQRQRSAALRLLDALCSPAGAELARGVIAHEDVSRRSPDRYWLRIYGAPGGGQPWGLSFSGHHLVLNATVVGGALSLLPAFWGANPAEVRHGAHAGFKLLRREEEMGRGLLLQLTAEQRRIAVASPEAPWDILTRNYRSVEGVPVPRGISAAELSPPQAAALEALIKLYAERLDSGVALAWLQGGVGEWGFVWSGAVEAGRPHYYALYSRELLVEYDNTQDGGNHIHTVMRSRGSDWGEDLLARHYGAAHKKGSHPL